MTEGGIEGWLRSWIEQHASDWKGFLYGSGKCFPSSWNIYWTLSRKRCWCLYI